MGNDSVSLVTFVSFVEEVFGPVSGVLKSGFVNDSILARD
jgi:hypothetical protein